MKRRMANQRGLTIVELLLALAISLVLMAGIYRVFIGSTDTYSVTDRLSRMQENGRFAIDLMKRDLRGAGFLGCAQDDGEFLNSVTTANGASALQTFLFDLDMPVTVFESTGVNQWQERTAGTTTTYNKTQLETKAGINDPLTGSDVIIIRSVDTVNPMQLTATTPPTADVPVASTLAVGEMVLVANCEGSTLIRVTGNSGTALAHSDGTANTDLGRTFNSGDEAFVAQTKVLFVRNNAAGVPALYQTVYHDPPLPTAVAAQELVDGVETMHIRLGQDDTANGAVDAYYKGNSASVDWADVLSVRIGILLSSDEVSRADTAAGSFDVDGDGGNDYTVATADRRMRLVMSGTMGLRNRLR